jgi:hypothetical protein
MFPEQKAPWFGQEGILGVLFADVPEDGTQSRHY